MNRRCILFFSLMLTAAGATGLSAQQRPPASAPAKAVAAPSPVAATPARTTASFADWTLRCDQPEGGPRTCEVAQAIGVQAQPNPIAQLAIGRAVRGQPLQLTLLLPVNVSFTRRPGLKSGNDAPIDLNLSRCVPVGCFASTTITDEALRLLATRAEPGTISFKDAADRDVTLPLSLRGLTQALDAMAKEA